MAFLDLGNGLVKRIRTLLLSGGNNEYALQTADVATDTTTSRVRAQSVRALGSGGDLAADGQLHLGACGDSIVIISNDNAAKQTNIIYDGTSASTRLVTVIVPPGDTVQVNIGSVATGIYIDLGTNCRATAFVGAAVL